MEPGENSRKMCWFFWKRRSRCIAGFFVKGPQKFSLFQLLCCAKFNLPRLIQSTSGWWFQPIWKICSSKWIVSPNRGENKKYLEPPPRLSRNFVEQTQACQEFSHFLRCMVILFRSLVTLFFHREDVSTTPGNWQPKHRKSTFLAFHRFRCYKYLVSGRVYTRKSACSKKNDSYCPWQTRTTSADLIFNVQKGKPSKTGIDPELF